MPDVTLDNCEDRTTSVRLLNANKVLGVPPSGYPSQIQNGTLAPGFGNTAEVRDGVWISGPAATPDGTVWSATTGLGACGFFASVFQTGEAIRVTGTTNNPPLGAFPPRWPSHASDIDVAIAFDRGIAPGTYYVYVGLKGGGWRVVNNNPSCSYEYPTADAYIRAEILITACADAEDPDPPTDGDIDDEDPDDDCSAVTLSWLPATDPEP